MYSTDLNYMYIYKHLLLNMLTLYRTLIKVQREREREINIYTDKSASSLNRYRNK